MTTDCKSNLSSIALRFIVIVFVGLWGQSLLAVPSTVQVGNCQSKIGYPTIGAAITAVPPGGTVLVCPGTYSEQLEINKNLTLKGIADGNNDAVIIVPPAAGLTVNTTQISPASLNRPTATQIFVHNASDVDISNLTVDGANNKISSSADCLTQASSSPALMAIYFRAASGSIKNVATRNQLLDAGVPCKRGYGLVSETGGASASITLDGNSVRLYHTMGIVVRDTGNNATIKENSVIGRGAGITDFFQNGIEMAFGARGTISGNFVTDNAVTASTSILCGSCHDVSIIGNIVGNSSNGIINESDGTFGDADFATIASNVIFGAGDPALLNPSIYICSNNASVHDNQISGSLWVAIQVDNSCLIIASGAGNNNVFKDNRINEACSAFLLATGVTGNVLKDNDYFNVLQKVKTGSTCP